MDKEDFIAIMIVAWVLWTARSEVVFNNGNPNKEVLALSFLNFFKELTTYNEKVGIIQALRETISLPSWEQPPAGLVKIDTDSSTSVGTPIGLGL